MLSVSEFECQCAIIGRTQHGRPQRCCSCARGFLYQVRDGLPKLSYTRGIRGGENDHQGFLCIMRTRWASSLYLSRPTDAFQAGKFEYAIAIASTIRSHHRSQIPWMAVRYFPTVLQTAIRHHTVKHLLAARHSASKTHDTTSDRLSPFQRYACETSHLGSAVGPIAIQQKLDLSEERFTGPGTSFQGPHQVAKSTLAPTPTARQPANPPDPGVQQRGCAAPVIGSSGHSPAFNLL